MSTKVDPIFGGEFDGDSFIKAKGAHLFERAPYQWMVYHTNETGVRVSCVFAAKLVVTSGGALVFVVKDDTVVASYAPSAWVGVEVLDTFGETAYVSMRKNRK